MAGKNDNFDALMAMMALKHIMDDTKDIEIHPFTCEVVVTPTSISCSSSGNKAFLEDIDGGMEWAEETNNLIKDIMSEQTIKLTDLMKKKFGFDTVKVKPNSEDGFADFLNAEDSPFGKDIVYDKTISTVQKLPIDEYSKLFIDVVPVLNEDGSTDTEPDYICVCPKHDLQQNLWAIRKIKGNIHAGQNNDQSL